MKIKDIFTCKDKGISVDHAITEGNLAEIGIFKTPPPRAWV